MRTVKSAKVRRHGDAWAVTFAFRDEGPEQAVLMENGAVGGLLSGVKGRVDHRVRSDIRRIRFENNTLYALLAEKTGMTLTGLKQVVMSRMEDTREIDRDENGPQGRQAA